MSQPQPASSSSYDPPSQIQSTSSTPHVSADQSSSRPASSGASFLTSNAPSSSFSASRRKPYSINGGKQITRSRVSYSCYTCRRRKVKCDKVHPACGNCVKTGSECMYDARSLQHRRPSDENHLRANVRRRRELQRLADAPLAELLSTHGGLKELQRQDLQLRGAGSEEIAARLDRLTSMIERLSQTQPSQDGNAAAIASQRQGIGQDLTSGRGEPGVHASHTCSSTRSSSPRRTADHSGSEDFPIPAGLETDLVDPVGTLNLGHLSLDECGKSRYVGTTYWAYISDEIHELNRLLREQSRSQDPPSFPANSSPEAHSAASHPRERAESWSTRHRHVGASVLFPPEDSPSSHGTAIVPEALDHVPTRRQSNILYKGFMSGVQAISPVLHPPTILNMYQDFWEWYEYRAYTGEPCPKPSFIPLLYAIWYGGSVTISLKTIHAEFDVETRSMLSGPFHDEVTRWLKKISFPRNASLYGLAAFLLVQTILSKEEEPLTSSLFISMALRVAQTMGLHRDPAQFGIQACEAEARRRVWWHIIHMDGVVAMSSGLPPQVSDENYWDVRLTSELKDTLIGTPQGEEYERTVNEGTRKPDRPDEPSVCGNSMVNVHYISAKGKYIMAKAIRRILKIQLGTKPVTRKDMEDLRSILIDLQAKLHALVDRIPIPKPQELSGRGQTTYPGLKPDMSNGGPGCLEQYHTPVLAAFHKWVRIVLSLFVDKAFCVAYQPFLKNAKSKIWPAARQCALRHCHGFMEKFILLATDPDFQPFQWSWPGNHQPMHATMIMLIDLYERPNSPEAPKSRAFIDKIFSLSGPDGGVVGGEDGISTARPLKDGGREAWDMMRRLREKAWQKAGLDPKVLWTEQAQMHAYVAQHQQQQQKQQHQQETGMKTHIRTGSQDRGVASTTNFADSYYAMIKEGYEAQSQKPQHQRNEVSRRNAHHFQTSSMTTESSWRSDKSVQNSNAISTAASSTPAPPSDLQQMWPSPPLPLFQDLASPSSLPLFQFSDTNTGDGISELFGDTKRAPSTTSDPNQDYHLQQPQQQQQQHRHHLPLPLSDFSQSTAPSSSTGLDMNNVNVNFDWDQWDAVFGEHLPVVDGVMDIDLDSHGHITSPTTVNVSQHPRQRRNHSFSQAQTSRGHSYSMSLPGAGAGGPGLLDTGSTYTFPTEPDQDVGLKNWADFG
ncbi:hypothetical protein VTO42DRAFT_1922 [Malbranchea cinnamomea]